MSKQEPLLRRKTNDEECKLIPGKIVEDAEAELRIDAGDVLYIGTHDLI